MSPIDDLSAKDFWRYALWASLGLGAITKYPTLNLAYHTAGGDMSYFIKLLQTARKTAVIFRGEETSTVHFLDRTVEKHPDKVRVDVVLGDQHLILLDPVSP